MFGEYEFFTDIKRITGIKTKTVTYISYIEKSEFMAIIK